MHEEILSPKQLQLLSLIKSFAGTFYLIGGTGIALQIGHRRSIDFDLVSFGDLDIEGIKRKIREVSKIQTVLVESPHELSVVVNDVKITFLYFPFKFSVTDMLSDVIKVPDLITLSALKSYALGRRAKWKDYVDLYFILKKHSFSEVVLKTKNIFGNEFNEKLYREQLSYFNDIDYSEKIDYIKGFEVADKIIKSFLVDKSLQR
jgi:hypothetical protein